VGSDIAKPGVQVTDGLFSVELDVTHSHFNGQGLWLEVEVGGVAIGCQEILPVPYALSLRPGAVITDSSSHVELNRYYSSLLPYGAKTGVYAKAEGTGIFNSYYGVYGSGTDYGVYGHSDSGAAIYGNGDVKQNREGNGLVKAAVYVDCNNDLLLGNIREFNNVTSNAIFPSPGSMNGNCTLDFGFDISDRFWVATVVAMAGESLDQGVKCWLGSSNDTLECFRYHASSGTGDDGTIMVLVY